ncbi:hypothetical protein BJY01DRAFT_252653 [Aspergillus pseudoustus]|uniref:Zinc-ribbon domain-containing protein n=1 Tax=Aspergillus pseudoustus TaxID=1810923 RepID=A0ABR4J5Z8_9EURO
MATHQALPVMQPQAHSAALPPSQTHLSKWWPISFFIAAVVFFIIGGGLVGAWNSNYYYDDSMGTFQGAIACFAIGGLCKLVGWILVIIYCTQRRPSRQTTVTYVSHPLTTYPGGPSPASVSPVPVHSPAPPYPNIQTPLQHQGVSMKFCGQCGASLTSPFCTQCGSKGV